MDTNSITQLHNITPEDFKKDILNGVSQLFVDFQKKMGLYDQNTFLNRKELSEMLNISLPTLRKYVKKGMIPETSVGGRVVYNLADVKEALKQNNLQD